jgi:hypothetical protein
VTEAAAQAVITPRSMQRWRAVNPAFARRYEEALARRLDIFEDLAMRRAQAGSPDDYLDDIALLDAGERPVEEWRRGQE